MMILQHFSVDSKKNTVDAILELNEKIVESYDENVVSL